MDNKFTLTLNGKVQGHFDTWEHAEKAAENIASHLFENPKNKGKFPWGFAFRIHQVHNTKPKTYRAYDRNGREIRVTIPED